MFRSAQSQLSSDSCPPASSRHAHFISLLLVVAIWGKRKLKCSKKLWTLKLSLHHFYRQGPATMKEYTINNRSIAKYCVLCLSMLQKSHSCIVHSRVVSPSIENSVFLNSTFLAVVLRVETCPTVSMKMIFVNRDLAVWSAFWAD